MGASSKLKLKGIQEMAIMDFDLSSLKGKKVDNARLYLCNAGDNKLRKIGLSTVSSPWIEGKSRGYFVDIFGKGATFNYSSYKSQRWAGEGSDLTDVTMGNGNTWQHHSEIQNESDLWWSVDIAPELIQALITKKSYGLLIMDESGQTFANNYVFSRESEYSPYILINFTEAEKPKPNKLDIELFPSVKNAHMEYGAVVLRIPIKEDIFAFDMFINNEEVPIWRVPKPQSKDTVQEIIIDWLLPQEKIDIQIVAVDKLGQRSEPAIVRGYASKSLHRIALPDYLPVSSPANERMKKVASNNFRVWVLPDITKVDPVSGRVLSEINTEGFDKKNPIWSEEKRGITLLGIKGEIIGFQICIEAADRIDDELEFNLIPLKSSTGSKISADRFSLFQIHYLKVKDKWYPELAIPMRDGKIVFATERRQIGNQKNQIIYVDLSIPSEIEAGSYHGDIVISRSGIKEESLHINLNVANVVMPRTLTFVPELNIYGGPGKAGSEKFMNAHRIAHEHRTVINRVPYSQDGRVHTDMIPEISFSENGQIKIDWTDYDKRLGPLFDGSAFIKGNRKGIPVEKFYLPFFENWPSELASHYKYKFESKKTQEIISRHALESPILSEAITFDYKEKFVRIIKEFGKHFEEKGWSQTEFQFYLNNKWEWEMASSWWNLDEPMSYDDWMALKFYGVLFQQAIGTKPAQFIFRADISRQRWQHDWLNGILNRMYVQSEDFFRYPARARQLKEKGQISYSVYGSLNDIDTSNQQTVLWCMRAYLEGADGVLPWQSLGGPKAFSIPDRNALIVDAGKGLNIDWVVSLRVKALRRGQQNVELLALLEKKYGYNREQMRDLFYRYFNFVDVNDVDKQINTDKMENFRKILIEML
ncbi:MAG: hypothetical protein HY757_02155 [Nitrospirae bacterium]|nr:hypothetical protein [Nitrospirota bacterium]